MAASSNDGKVEITLAHPLRKRHVDALGLHGEKAVDANGDLPLETTLWVTPETARSLITAGYATVDSEDDKAVQDALTPAKPLPATETAGIVDEKPAAKAPAAN